MRGWSGEVVTNGIPSVPVGESTCTQLSLSCRHTQGPSDRGWRNASIFLSHLARLSLKQNKKKIKQKPHKQTKTTKQNKTKKKKIPTQRKPKK